MPSPDNWPPDVVTAAALVATAIRDIDRSGDVQRDHLLSNLLCAVWPTRIAQNQ
jgi:hypothetical protein